MQHTGAPAASWKNALTVYYGTDTYAKLGWRGPPTTRVHLTIHFGNGSSYGDYVTTGDFTDETIYYRMVFNNTHISAYYREVDGEWIKVTDAERVTALNTTSYKIILGKGHEASTVYTNPDLDNDYYMSGDSGTDYMDNVFIRKYVDNTPGHGDWNCEESSQYNLSDWRFRRYHIISGSTGAGCNYQVPIIVNYNSGYTMGNVVNLQAKCQTDFDDIRFTASDGITLLNHWRESYTTSDVAFFWVEVKDNLDSVCRIYIYYGNELAATASDGHATFLFFDDFEGVSVGEHPDSTKWTVYGSEDAGNYTAIEYDPIGGSNHVLRCKQGGDGEWNYARSIDINVTHGVAIGFKWRRDAYSYHSYQSAMDMDGNYLWTARYYAASPKRIMFYDGASYQDLDPDFYWSVNTWYSTEIQIVSTILNYTDCSDGNEYVGDLRTSPYAGLQWFHSFADYKNSIYSGYSDDYYVRKYIEDEPEHYAWSIEESLY